MPGIGRKGAQRLVIELKDKINTSACAPRPATQAARPRRGAWRDQVTQGLQGLGWSATRRRARPAPRSSTWSETIPARPVAALMRAALQTLGAVVTRRCVGGPDEDLPDLVVPHADPDERAAESALRPRSLAEFEGQPRVSDQLGLVLEAARHRGGSPTTSCSRDRPASARPRWP